MFALSRVAKKPAEIEPLPLSQVGRALKVTGLLEIEGELHVHGTVSGRINAERVVLGTGGCIEGDVVARDVCIGGRLTGRVFALHVTVESTADINGRVFHNTITVDKGARIDGRMPWRPLNYFETLERLPEIR
ncbi:MAG: polymer-forming cytoskeletal protein [Alphaproteobacteria bacterium]|nr:polymer-forming cytoskeletal protein [Alphaproteobacteria bacterium]